MNIKGTEIENVIIDSIREVLGKYTTIRTQSEWKDVKWDKKSGKVVIDGQERKLGKTIAQLTNLSPGPDDYKLNRILGLIQAGGFEESIEIRLEDNATDIYSRAFKDSRISSCMVDKPNQTCFYDNTPDIKMAAMYDKATGKVIGRAIVYEEVFGKSGKKYTFMDQVYPLGRTKYEGAYTRFLQERYENVIRRSSGYSSNYRTTANEAIYYPLKYDARKPEEWKLAKMDTLYYLVQMEDGRYALTDSHKDFAKEKGIYYYVMGMETNYVKLNPVYIKKSNDFHKEIPRKAKRGRPRKNPYPLPEGLSEEVMEKIMVDELLETDETKLFDVYGNML